MSVVREFVRGEPLTTGNLNPIARAAKRVEGAPGAPAATIAAPGTATPPLPVLVVARSVSVPAVLADHQYTVRLPGGQELVIDHAKLIVEVEPLLLSADTAPNERPMGFWPAEVVGTAQAADTPWRARGLLYRFPGADGQPDHAVKLFGLCVARGC